MTTSQTQFLTELAAGHSGPTIPAGKRAYFQQRLRNRVFNLLLTRFAEQKANGLTKAILARRIEKSPDLITRWLGTPSNLTVDTISDLLIGISGEELELETSSPLTQIASNYSHINDEETASATRTETQFQGQNEQAKTSVTSKLGYTSNKNVDEDTP